MRKFFLIFASIFLVIIFCVCGYILCNKNNKSIEIGRIEKIINEKGKELDYKFAIVNYDVCIKRLLYDHGVRKGYCEMVISNADGSDKYINASDPTSSTSIFGDIQFGIDGLGGISSGEKKVIDGKLHIFFELESLWYIDDKENKSSIKFTRDSWESIVREYVLEDTDRRIIYTKCDKGVEISITDYCIRLQGENYMYVVPEELLLIYENGEVEKIFEAGECRGTGYNYSKEQIGDSEWRAFSLIDYNSKYELLELKEIVYNGRAYNVNIDET